MDDLLRLVLRLVGAFYLLAAILGLRAVAMDRLLTNAIAGITLGKASRGDLLRNRFLTVSSLSIGIAALALLALLDLALPLLLAALGLQLVYLCYLGPRLVDPDEAPEPGSRRKSVIATGVIAAVAFLGFAAWWRGLLYGLAEAPISAALAGAGLVALGGYAVRLSRDARLDRPSAANDDDGLRPADWPTDEPEIDSEELESTRIVLTPGWGRLGALDAQTGAELPYRIYDTLLMQHERDLLGGWNGLFIEVADPADPRRVAMCDPDGLRRLEEFGRPIFEMVAMRLGEGRVAFEPVPRPQLPTIEVAAVKVMADYGSHPLWFHDEERVGCFSPGEFGLSWSLELDLGTWAMAFDDSLDPDDPGGPARWSVAEAAAHVASGRGLARRLAAELTATGRGHVRVLYHPAGGGIEPVAPT